MSIVLVGCASTGGDSPHPREAVVKPVPGRESVILHVPAS